jgi:hypothetical protein
MKYIPEELPEKCWLWKGPVDAEGYGCLKIDKVVYKAHRLSYELFTGDTPDICCHRCMDFGASRNNPLCVNPEHIYSGTKQDNRLDQKKYGEDANMKLTDTQVQDIRKVWNATQFKFGERKPFVEALSEKYQVAFGTIEGVVYGYDRN